MCIDIHMYVCVCLDMYMYVCACCSPLQLDLIN